MSVQVVSITRSAGGAAELAAAVEIVLYEGQHDLGTSPVVVAAYRAGEVWHSYTGKWTTHDGHVTLHVPASAGPTPHEILLIS